MNNDLTNLASGLIGAIIGSVVTFFGNLQLEKIKSRSDASAKKANLRLSLRLEFEAAIKCLDELKNALNNQNIYPFRWTTILKESLRRLEIQRPRFYLLTDIALQEKLFQLTTDLALFTNDVESIEMIWNNLIDNPPKRPNGTQIPDSNEVNASIEGVKEQRRLKLVELVDLKRRLDETVKSLQ